MRGESTQFWIKLILDQHEQHVSIEDLFRVLHESARAARETLEREAGRVIGDSGAPKRAGDCDPRAN